MTTISVEALKAKMDAGEKLNILDVRENDERADFNFGGTHLPLGKVQSLQIEDIEDLKDEDIYIYCRSGRRSEAAAYMLEQAGFKHTINVNGGILAWIDKFGR